MGRETSAVWVLGRPKGRAGLSPTFYLPSPRPGRKQASSPVSRWDQGAPGWGDLPAH